MGNITGCTDGETEAQEGAWARLSVPPLTHLDPFPGPCLSLPLPERWSLWTRVALTCQGTQCSCWSPTVPQAYRVWEGWVSAGSGR